MRPKHASSGRAASDLLRLASPIRGQHRILVTCGGAASAWAAGRATFLTAHTSSLVTSDGDPFGLPPYYMHHSHLSAGPGAAGMDPIKCTFYGTNCQDLGMMFGHHGDIIDRSEDGGMEDSAGRHVAAAG